MVPMVLFLLPLPETLLFVGIVHWFSDLWKVFLFKTGFDKKLVFLFGIPGILCAWIGGSLVVSFPKDTSSRLVGGILLAYVFYTLFKPKAKIKNNYLWSVVGGAGSGFMGGLTGIGGGALRAIVLTSFKISKESYLFLAGLLGALIDISRIGAYITAGVKLNFDLVVVILISIGISLWASKLAKKWIEKISNDTFRKIIAFLLFLLGTKLILYP